MIPRSIVIYKVSDQVNVLPEQINIVVHSKTRHFLGDPKLFELYLHWTNLFLPYFY